MLFLACNRLRWAIPIPCPPLDFEDDSIWLLPQPQAFQAHAAPPPPPPPSPPQHFSPQYDPAPDYAQPQEDVHMPDATFDEPSHGGASTSQQGSWTFPEWQQMMYGMMSQMQGIQSQMQLAQIHDRARLDAVYERQTLMDERQIRMERRQDEMYEIIRSFRGAQLGGDDDDDDDDAAE